MRLKQDIIRIDGKKIFINPFLYSRKFDQKSKRWLREPGQISKSRIELNRSKYYPDIKWEILSLNEKQIKETTIELFLKTIEIIKTFNSTLNSEQLIEVEKKLIYHQKIYFEKISKNFFIKKEELLLKEKRKLGRAIIISNWQKWLSLKETQKLIIPVFVIMLVSALLGWFAGISNNSCNPYFESSSSYQL
tara:strand:+ start:658 stop:1230 length:573 start_codon:yes stop_codon:yes gene_type:complete